MPSKSDNSPPAQKLVAGILSVAMSLATSIPAAYFSYLTSRAEIDAKSKSVLHDADNGYKTLVTAVERNDTNDRDQESRLTRVDGHVQGIETYLGLLAQRQASVSKLASDNQAMVLRRLYFEEARDHEDAQPSGGSPAPMPEILRHAGSPFPPLPMVRHGSVAPGDRKRTAVTVKKVKTIKEEMEQVVRSAQEKAVLEAEPKIQALKSRQMKLPASLAEANKIEAAAMELK